MMPNIHYGDGIVGIGRALVYSTTAGEAVDWGARGQEGAEPVINVGTFSPINQPTLQGRGFIGMSGNPDGIKIQA